MFLTECGFDSHLGHFSSLARRIAHKSQSRDIIPDMIPSPAPASLRRKGFLGLPSLSGKALPLIAWMVMALAALPQLMYPLWFDQGAFAACGAALRGGGVFLRDCWEARGPLTPLLYTVPMLVSVAPVALRVFDIVWQAGTALALGGLARDMFGKTAGNVAALLYFLMYATLNYWATAQAEGFANLFFILAIWMTWRATGGTGRGEPGGVATAIRLPDYLLAGLAAGLLFWSKYPFALIAVALAFWIWARAGLGAVPRFLAGVAAGLGIGLAYFAMNGALAELGQHLDYAVATFHNVPLAHRLEWLTGVFWVEVKAFVAMGNTPTAGFKATVIPMDDVLGRGYPFIMLLALAGAVSALLSRDARRAGGLALLYWVVTVVLQMWQGHSYRYHFVITLPAFALLAAAATRGRDAGLLSLRRWVALAPMLAVLAAVIGMGAAIFPWTRDALANLLVERKPLQQVYLESRLADYSLLADFIRPRTAPTDGIIVFGDVPAVYALAGRPMGARFPYLRWAMEGASPAGVAAYSQQFLADMRIRRPKFFILPKVGIPSDDFDFVQIWKDMVPVHAEVEANYGFVGEVGTFIVFERK